MEFTNNHVYYLVVITVGEGTDKKEVYCSEVSLSCVFQILFDYSGLYPDFKFICESSDSCTVILTDSDEPQTVITIEGV